jgi:DNA-binding transcriptional LysR family regulator
MIDLNDFRFFVHIVDRGGFTAASVALDVPKSTLSHRIMKLEEDLGVRLLNRSSRHVGATEAGRDFYHHAVEVLRKAEMAETVVRRRLSEPSGVVRITAGIATMRFALNEIITDFLVKFPKVDVIAQATDVAVDIIRENYDVAIRGHSNPLPDSNLVQRTLMTQNFHLFAGIEYLAEHGEPQTPQDLTKHAALFMMRERVPSTWRLRHLSDDHDDVILDLEPRLMTDDVSGLQSAAIAGLGIVALPRYMCRDAVRRGALRLILPDWSAGTGVMTALVPYRQGMLPSVRCFLDHLGTEVPKLAIW